MAINRIMLAGDFRRDERVANATLYPGHLVEVLSTGKVQKHSTEAGYAERAFAIEDALQGNAIADAYAAADLVSINLVQPGAEVFAFLKAGEDVAIGEKLISAGDGTLIANGSETSGATVQQVVAIALEAKDLSASGAVATKMQVRVL